MHKFKIYMLCSTQNGKRNRWSNGNFLCESGLFVRLFAGVSRFTQAKKHCDLINFKWSEADCKVKLQKPCTFLFDSRWTFQRLWSWQNSFFPFFKFFRISLTLSHSRFLNLILRVRVCVCVFGVYRKRPFVKISWATNPVQRLNCIINSCIFVDFLPTQTKYFWNSTAGPAITHHQTEQTKERTNVIVYASKKRAKKY